MPPVPLPRLQTSRAEEIEAWPDLDEGVLLKTRSRKVCMTCHWMFRHHAGVNGIPLLTCQLHQGLIAHGEHLTSRCQGWTDDMVRQHLQVQIPAHCRVAADQSPLPDPLTGSVTNLRDVT